MAKPLDVTSLGLNCTADGDTCVTIWAKCWTADDIDDVIAWLKLAKAAMQKWETIRKKENDDNA